MSARKKYHAEWKAAGYSEKQASARFLPPPPPEVIRVYHITSAEFALNDIGLRRLKVARFSELNDPFELMALSLREEKVRAIVRRFKDDYDKQMGLLCFSADYRDPLLWGHYGAKHRGICLGFNLKRELASPVKYEPERLTDQLLDTEKPIELDDNLVRLLLTTKFEHWKYEEEYRYIVQLDKAVCEGSFHFRQFDEDLELAEVVLGAQCEMSVDAVRDFTRSHHAKVATFKARPAEKFYSVVPDEDTLPPKD